MTESEFNALYGALGYAPIELDGGFKIIDNDYRMDKFDFSAAVLQLSGGPYFYTGRESGYPSLGYYYFLAVIPDEAAAGLAVSYDGAAYNLKEETYDARALREELMYEYTTANGYTYLKCDYRIREYSRMEQNLSLIHIFTRILSWITKNP